MGGEVSKALENSYTDPNLIVEQAVLSTINQVSKSNGTEDLLVISFNIPTGGQSYTNAWKYRAHVSRTIF